MFQFTPVARRATPSLWEVSFLCYVSIHARRTTGDIIDETAEFFDQFQFTPVARRATRGLGAARHRARVSIHARRTTGDLKPYQRKDTRHVSIHARRTTGDCSSPAAQLPFSCFNSRPSHDGRPSAMESYAWTVLFQFTPVARRATRRCIKRSRIDWFQFTPVARRATSGQASCRRSAGFNSRPSHDGRPRQFAQLSPS